VRAPGSVRAALSTSREPADCHLLARVRERTHLAARSPAAFAQVEDFLTTVAASVLEEGGRSRQLKAAIAPILEDTIDDDEKISACHTHHVLCAAAVRSASALQFPIL
jgi:hypothetical protein